MYKLANPVSFIHNYHPVRKGPKPAIFTAISSTLVLATSLLLQPRGFAEQELPDYLLDS